MKLLNQIESVRVEIARLTTTIEEIRERIGLIEARETMAVSEERERLHSSAVFLRLESVKEYFAHRCGSPWLRAPS